MSGVEIMAAMAMTGSAMAAYGAIQQGKAAANSANYNAAIASQNAQVAGAQGEAAMQLQRRDAQRKIGAAMAAYGASGVQMADGSPADVLADSARMSTLDALTIKYNYRLKQLGQEDQAALDSSGATNARTASYFNAAGIVLGGAAKAYTSFGGSAGSSGNAGVSNYSFGNGMYGSAGYDSNF